MTLLSVYLQKQLTQNIKKKKKTTWKLFTVYFKQ